MLMTVNIFIMAHRDAEFEGREETISSEGVGRGRMAEVAMGPKASIAAKGIC